MQGQNGRPPRPPLADRRVLLGGIGAAVVLAGAVVGGLVTLRSGSGSVAVSANSVAVVDPVSNKVVADIPAGLKPVGIAVDPRPSGSVWVVSAESSTLTQIDPATRATLETIGLRTKPAAIAVGGGGVWVANGGAGTLARVDPATETVVKTITVPGDLESVAAGREGVWATTGTHDAIELDPLTNKPSKVARVSDLTAEVAEGNGAVWTAGKTGVVDRIDPRTGSSATFSRFAGFPYSLAAAGSVWASGSDSAVFKVDPSAARAVAVGANPRGIAIGAAGIWVANSGDGTLSRIDPVSGRVTATIELGHVPFALAVGHGAVWVTVLAKLP